MRVDGGSNARSEQAAGGARAYKDRRVLAMHNAGHVVATCSTRMCQEKAKPRLDRKQEACVWAQRPRRHARIPQGTRNTGYAGGPQKCTQLCLTRVLNPARMPPTLHIGLNLRVVQQQQAHARKFPSAHTSRPAEARCPAARAWLPLRRWRLREGVGGRL